MHRDEKFFARETDIQPVVTDATALPGQPHLMCDFCGKMVTPVDSMSSLEKLSGPGHFFCGFCLRHNRNTKNRRNVLVLSYRGLFAYLYFEVYVAQRLVSFSEIEDAIDAHVAVGLKNPVFAYDAATMLWHVDFSRVGGTKKKLPVEEVKTTVNDVLKNLTLPALGNTVQWSKLESKYVDAVDGFYQKRSRPPTRRLLIPTMKGCGPLEPKGANWDRHKDFVRSNMLVRFG